jgi:hypothetical protein
VISLKPGTNCILYLAERALPAEHVTLAPTTAETLPSPELAAKSEKHWAHTKEEHPHAFNGILYNLHGIEYANGKLIVSTSRTDYKTYSFLRDQPSYRLFDHGIAVIGTSCILLTGDHKMIIAQRGKGLVGEGNLHTIPGGMFNVKYPTFINHIRYELTEELGVQPAETSSLTFHGIGYDAAHAKGAEFLFSIRTSLTAAEVIARHAKAQDRNEADDISAIPEDDLSSYVRTHRATIMRGSLANILAYLHHSGDTQAYAIGEAI